MRGRADIVFTCRRCSRIADTATFKVYDPRTASWLYRVSCHEEEAPVRIPDRQLIEAGFSTLWIKVFDEQLQPGSG